MTLVTGIIIRRKSFGKFLAFATLKVLTIINDDDSVIVYNSNETPISTTLSSIIGIETLTINDEKIDILRICFQRNSPNWDKKYDSTFPTKNSMLAYGSKIKVHLKERHPDKHSGCNQEVCSWEILEDPNLIAMEKAKQRSNKVQGEVCDLSINYEESETDNNGVLLHEYLRARGKLYLQYNDFDYNESMKARKNHNPMKAYNYGRLNKMNNATSTSIHGDKKAKSLRAKVFAAWLVDEFGVDLLKANNGVLDVAGGKGQLSIELTILASDVQCTVIDPFIRGRSAEGKFLPNKEMKRIKKVDGRVPRHIAQYFSQDEGCNQLVAQSSCVVGLHPDQPTEDIVDLALIHNKPFACIPCCVFPGMFTMRRLSCGKFVQTYDDFIQYLLEKDSRVETTTLNFEGKNRVIFFKGE